jgi:glycosyltransferase involved in cell wall biosynthesis
VEPVCFVGPYPPGRAHLGGGGWVDRRLLAALNDAGADVAVHTVTGPSGRWSEDGIDGTSAGDLPLEVRGDRRALARIVTAMLRSTEPYLAAKFTAFPGWAVAAAGLRSAAAGRRVITSGWPALLLADAADLHVDVHVAHNVDLLIAEAHSPRPLRLLGEVPRLRRRERSLLQRPRSVVALSRTDAERLRRWGIEARPLPVPLGVVPHPARGTSSDVGFVGKASWPPNAEALEVLLGPVHEALARLGSDAVYRLGGAGTEAFADHPRVASAGWVPDLDRFYDGVGFVVVPRLGVSTGVSVKMLEAAEHGVAVLVPSTLAEAVDPAGPWIVADSPDALAAALVDSDPVEHGARTAEWAARQDPSLTAATLLDLLHP